MLTLVEPAGFTDSILSGNRLNISNERVLFPRDSQFSGEATYTLSNSNLDNLKGGNPLIFSGDWVGLIGTAMKSSLLLQIGKRIYPDVARMHQVLISITYLM